MSSTTQSAARLVVQVGCHPGACREGVSLVIVVRTEHWMSSPGWFSHSRQGLSLFGGDGGVTLDEPVRHATSSL